MVRCQHLNTSPLQPVYVLLECSHAQHLHFLLCEEAPVAAAEVLLGESCELYAVELNDAVAEVFEDTTHDAVLAAVNLDAYLALVCVACVLDSVCMYLAVLQLDALSNLLHVVSCYVLVEEYVVHLLLQELRVCELRSEVAVVGEQEHAGCVAVESAYGVDALRAHVLHEVHHGLTLLWVVACCHAVLWFVEQHVHLLLECYGLVVEFYLVCALDLGAELGHYLSVHTNHACLDELVCLTARADTCVGEELVQTKRFVRIVVLLLVFNALFHAVLSVGVVARCALTLLVATLLVAALLSVATAVVTAALLIAALLTVATTLLIAALLTVAAALLISALLTLTIATALLIAALLTWLVSALLLFAVLVVAWAIALLTWLVSALLLFAVLVVAWAIALLTRLVSVLLLFAVLVVAWTIAALRTLLIAAAVVTALLTWLIAALLL